MDEQRSLAINSRHQTWCLLVTLTQKLWHKGEESGHIQVVKEIQLDCDADVIILQIEQLGGIACHTGRQSCFYRTLDDNQQWQIVEPVLKDPHAIYEHPKHDH